MKRLFDIERGPGANWDIRPWPLKMRLEFRRKGTTSGVERRLGVYRISRWHYEFVWWRGG